MGRLARGALVFMTGIGVIFLGQGVGLIPGSFMTGRSEWAVIGAFLAATGALVLWSTSRGKAG